MIAQKRSIGGRTPKPLLKNRFQFIGGTRIGWSKRKSQVIYRLVGAISAYSSWAGRPAAGWVLQSALTILVMVLTFTPAAAQSTPNQPNLKALFAAVGRMHNIDPGLLEAMAEVESGGDPLSVSPKGALGLMQLMPATASAFSVLNPFNPDANLRGAADFLDYLRNRFANNPNLQGLPALLAAYNAGPGAVEKYGGIPPYAETNRYVQRVIERYKNAAGTQAAVAPVLILDSKVYVMQLSGPHAMQPEPVLISADSEGSAQNELATIRNVSGQVVAVVGTGTAPRTRRNPTELTAHREDQSGSTAIVVH
jgi:hypothetical protein